VGNRVCNWFRKSEVPVHPHARGEQAIDSPLELLMFFHFAGVTKLQEEKRLW
jgi:hypothetical protein